MDVALNICDNAVFDKMYPSSMERTDITRQIISLYLIVTIGGAILYLTFATLNYYTIFDHSLMKHKRFLKNQRWLEIECSLTNIPKMAVPTTLIFLSQVRGYSPLYDEIDEYGWGYWTFSLVSFMFWLDCAIYWIHRWLHIPFLYTRFHKPHHKWLVPTPYASHAFHWVDGFSQSLPYHMFASCIPLHKWTYLALFVFVNIWTVSIHDGDNRLPEWLQDYINGAAHHTDHHLHFNYNYGQFFTLWDIIGGSHRNPDVTNIKIMDKDLIRKEIPVDEIELLASLNKTNKAE